MTSDTIDDRHAEGVRLARDKWADYQRLLAEHSDNHIAVGLRERGLAETVPHLLAAYEAQWAEVEAWLKARRDLASEGYPEWDHMDEALGDLREHMHTGTPLGEPIQPKETK